VNRADLISSLKLYDDAVVGALTGNRVLAMTAKMTKAQEQFLRALFDDTLDVNSRKTFLEANIADITNDDLLMHMIANSSNLLDASIASASIMQALGGSSIAVDKITNSKLATDKILSSASAISNYTAGNGKGVYLYKGGITPLFFVYANYSEKARFFPRPDYLDLKAYAGTLESVKIENSQTINLTNANYVKINWENTGVTSDDNISRLEIRETPGGDYVVRILKYNNFSLTTDSIDVSSLSGDFYIAIGAQGSTVASYLAVYNIYVC